MRQRKFMFRDGLPASLLSRSKCVSGLLAWCLMAAPVCASAQTVLLEDVVRSVLTQSPQILLENERVRRAEGQLQRAQGPFDWTASGESGWERLYVSEANNGVLTDNLREIDAWRTTIGVGRQFRNGITVQPGVSFYANAGGTEAQTQGLTKVRPALNLTSPLLRGFGEDSEVATNERAAVHGLDASRHGREYVAQSALTNAVLVFWRCLALKQQLAIVEEDQRGAADFLESIRAFVESGEGEPAALDRALANQAVQNVTLSRTRASIQTCRRDLDVAMGGDGTREPVPEGAFPEMDGVTEPASRLNGVTLADDALARREDVRALSLQNAAQAELVRGARDGMQPQVNVSVDPQRVMVRVSQSLGRSAQEGALSEALAGESESRINLRQQESQVRLEIAENLRGLQDALINWQALKESAAAMEVIAGEAERRYQTGFSTRQEYRSVQEETAAIQRQVIEAQLQYASYLGALRLALGRIDAGEDVPTETLTAQFRSLPVN